MSNTEIKQILINLKCLKQLTEDEKTVIQKKFESDEMDARKIYYALYMLEEHNLKDMQIKKKLSINEFRKIVSRKYKSTHSEDYIRKLIEAEKVNRVLGEKVDSVREPILRPMTKLLDKNNGTELIRKVWKSAKDLAGAKKVKRDDVIEALGSNWHEPKHRRTTKFRLESENTEHKIKSFTPIKSKPESENTEHNYKSSAPNKSRLEYEIHDALSHKEIIQKIIPVIKRRESIARRVFEMLNEEFSECLNKNDLTLDNMELDI